MKQTIHSNILSTEKRKAQIIWTLNLAYFQDKLKKKKDINNLQFISVSFE